MVKITALLLLSLSLLTACLPQNPGPGQGQELLPGVDLGAGEPVAVSADGRFLLIVCTIDERHEAWLLDRENENRKKIYEFTGATFEATFSPLGDYLAIASDQLLLFRVADTEEEFVLKEEEAYGPIAWAPHGRELAFIAREKINIVDLQGSSKTLAPAPESVRQLSWIDLPEGQERLFFSSFPAEAPAFVGSISPDGADLRSLAEAEIFAVHNHRLYLSDPLEEGRLWTANIDDGSMEELLLESAVQDFAVDPTGRKIALLLQQEEMFYELWLLEEDKELLTQLTAGSLVLSPLWEPQGKGLYYGAFDLEQAEENDEPFRVMKLEIGG